MTEAPEPYHYQFRTDPYAHQREALRRAWLAPGFAFLMEMGTGKTKVMIDEVALYWETGHATCAVFMAPKGVCRNWVHELETHLPERIKRRICMWRPGGGNKTQHRELRALLAGDDLRILVMNIEALSTGTVPLTYLRKFLASGRAYAAVDESTFIKEPSATRTQNVTAVASLAEFRRIATGSPVTRSPLDLYSQFSFLGERMLGVDNWYAFRAKYAILKTQDFEVKRRNAQGEMQKTGKKVRHIVGYRSLDDLQERVKRHSYRVLKEECLDLPAKIYMPPREVEMTEEQERLYHALVADSIAELDNLAVVTTTNVLTRILRLQQILCGHVGDDDGEVHDVPTRRPEALLEVLAETSGKAIIWSRFRRDIEVLAARLEREYGVGSVAQFHGGNVGSRDAEAARWHSDPDCRWMISSQQSGGYGNTWLPGTTVVYYSDHLSLEKRQQSEDRSHRSGQTQHVTYINLTCPGTVEEKILKTLRKGMDIAAAVTGDGYREWII